jgi:hypothetical protein
MAGLLMAGLSGAGYGLERPVPPAEKASLGGSTTRFSLTVRQGRLSVDLWEVEVGEVLARIGHEAGVLITGNPTSGARVSVQFTDLELEVGLRRLLRRTSLSYAVRYARDSAGAVAMQEVRVFGAASEEPLSPLNTATGTGPDPPARSRVGPQPPAD